MGGIKPNGSWTERISRNIERLIAERQTSKHSLMKTSGIARSTFYRKLDQHPEQFTAAELGSIAEALEATVTDLFAEA